MMTTNHENHGKLSPGVASGQRPSARPQSRGSSASSDLSLSACPGTEFLPPNLLRSMHRLKHVGTGNPGDFHVISTWKKTLASRFQASSFIELYDMAIKKWIYHMGISWEYPGCEDAAGSRPSKNPMGILRLSHNLQTTPYLNHRYSRKISTTLGQTFGCGTSPREFIQTYCQWAIFHIYANVYPKAKHSCFHHLSLTT